MLQRKRDTLREIEASVFGRVKQANLQGRLYPVPSGEERDAVDALVRLGALLPVESTATSARGYVALEFPQGSLISH